VPKKIVFEKNVSLWVYAKRLSAFLTCDEKNSDCHFQGSQRSWEITTSCMSLRNPDDRAGLFYEIYLLLANEYERRYHKKERVKCLNKSKKESNVHRVDAGMYDWFV